MRATRVAQHVGSVSWVPSPRGFRNTPSVTNEFKNGSYLDIKNDVTEPDGSMNTV